MGNCCEEREYRTKFRAKGCQPKDFCISEAIQSLANNLSWLRRHHRHPSGDSHAGHRWVLSPCGMVRVAITETPKLRPVRVQLKQIGSAWMVCAFLTACGKPPPPPIEATLPESTTSWSKDTIEWRSFGSDYRGTTRVTSDGIQMRNDTQGLDDAIIRLEP